MGKTKILKPLFWDEFKDYFFITLGCLCYAAGLVLFMIPYQFTPGGVSGVATVLFYATGVPIQVWYMGINIVLLLIGFRILGFKFFGKTIFAIIMMTIWLTILQEVIKLSGDNTLMLAGEEDFMAAVLAGCIEGFGLSLVFLNNGSTGGTDIIAAIVNKYKNVSMGRVLLYCDFVIVSCSYFVVNDLHKVIVSFVMIIIAMILLDYIMNSATQSVQFTIISDKYEEIAHCISSDLNRGVTVLFGEGWYSKEDRHVLLVIARRRESPQIFRLIKRIDNRAFVSQSKVVGVYGEGFDRIKE